MTDDKSGSGLSDKELDNKNKSLDRYENPGRRMEDDSVLSEDEDKDTQNFVYTIPVDHSGTSVYLKGWIQQDSPYPPVVMVHDLGESVRSYRGIAEEMRQSGFSIFVFDLRGHGRSGRHLGHVPSFDALVEDLLQVVAWVRYKSNGELPIIIGQGVGALVSVYFKKKYSKYTRETILVAPPASEGKSMAPMYRTFIRSMAEVTPRMRLPRSMVSQFLSLGGMEPTAKQQKVQGITLHFAKEVMQAISQLPEVMKSFTGPAMVVVPQQVSAYDLGAVKKLLESLPFKDDLRLVEIGNIGTQPLAKEKEFNVVLDSIYSWLEEELETTIER